MRNAILFALFIALAALAIGTVSRASGEHQPVVVELFTSEGCSDCPPADELLNAMARQRSADVIPLAFHVTYWDRAGWRDRFSDERFTDRQKNYQAKLHVPSLYTPQMVVDGQYQVVGNDAPNVDALIRRAAGDPKPVAVNIAPTEGSVTISARASDPSVKGRVLLAITEDDLSTAVTAGENRSRTLHHSAVVHSLQDVGALTGGAFSRAVSLKAGRDWQRDKLHAVAFVQDGDGHILGAAEVKP